MRIIGSSTDLLFAQFTEPYRAVVKDVFNLPQGPTNDTIGSFVGCTCQDPLCRAIQRHPTVIEMYRRFAAVSTTWKPEYRNYLRKARPERGA